MNETYVSNEMTLTLITSKLDDLTHHHTRHTLCTFAEVFLMQCERKRNKIGIRKKKEMEIKE